MGCVTSMQSILIFLSSIISSLLCIKACLEFFMSVCRRSACIYVFGGSRFLRCDFRWFESRGPGRHWSGVFEFVLKALCIGVLNFKNLFWFYSLEVDKPH